MTTNWGDLDQDAIDAIKNDIRRAVAEGVEDAISAGCVRDAIAQGMAAGIRATINDEQLFQQLVESTTGALKKSAAHASGQFILDGVSTIARRAVWFFLAGIIIYNIGGCAAVTAALKAINATSHP
jgi:hypothetical protein